MEAQDKKSSENSNGDDRVERFGYRESLKRDFTTWSAFALAFVFISPIIGLYGIFGLAFAAGGAAFWWGWLVVMVGQFLVALVFSELVSRWPIDGSIYQWSRRLLGNGYGWFAGWAYTWTLIITMAAVAYGAAGFLAPLLGIAEPSNTTLILLSLGLLVFSTLANTIARAVLKTIIVLSLVTSVLASLAIGTVLLLFYRENSLWVVFDSFGTAGDGSYLGGPFLAALAFVGWAIVGFESAGAVAEEVRDPERNVPKAILLSLVAVGVLQMYAALALILAIPNLGAVVAGEVGDPVQEVLAAQLGAWITTPLFIMVVVGFTTGLLPLQTSASRFIFSMGRDRAIPAAGFFARVSGSDRLPVNAILVSAVLAGGIYLLAGTNIYATIVSFSISGFYISFAFAAVAALIVRLRCSWQEGKFSLGRAGMAVNVAAVAWLLFEVVNIAWPRANELPWYENWAVVIMVVVLGVFGGVSYLWLRGRMSDSLSEDKAKEAGP